MDHFGRQWLVQPCKDLNHKTQSLIVYNNILFVVINLLNRKENRNFLMVNKRTPLKNQQKYYKMKLKLTMWKKKVVTMWKKKRWQLSLFSSNYSKSLR